MARRNRTVAMIMLAVALLSATMGALYLRHYGFNIDEKKEVRYH
jgi:hypothetical protein